MARIGPMIPTAWALYLVFLFVPAAHAVDISRAGMEMVVIELGAPFTAHAGESRVLLGAVGLSHLIMAISPFMLLKWRRVVQVACVTLLAAAAALQMYMVLWLSRYAMLEFGSHISVAAFVVLMVGYCFRIRAAGHSSGEVPDLPSNNRLKLTARGRPVVD